MMMMMMMCIVLWTDSHMCWWDGWPVVRAWI